MEAVEFGKKTDNDVYVAKECKITGKINSRTNVIIDGELEGTIETKADLLVGPHGKVEAEIFAVNARIQGEVHGNITVENLLVIASTAVVYGDIKTKGLQIEQGARFIGKSQNHDQAGSITELETKPETEYESEPSDNPEFLEGKKKSKLSFKPIVYNRMS
ncbi:MAG: polymer-forming cytoskeletal protein [Dehalobacter sp.]|nr:polymer-forming cytoskeletal protein [Dehalobacter sp.]